jgi:hypothetical protein
VISGLIAAYQSGLRLFAEVWNFLYETFRKAESRHIWVTFCTEAAVLIAVFPILETVLRNPGNQAAFGLWHIVIVSLFLTILFLLAAVILQTKD